MISHIVERYHDFSAGHRVSGHESKCAHLHGHNYRVHFAVTSAVGLDGVGRVVDFSIVKGLLCAWLEDNWDHKMILWERDPLARYVMDLDRDGVVLVDFNPTAELMAEHLVEVVGPKLLKGTGLELVSVRVEETRKCSATYSIKGFYR